MKTFNVALSREKRNKHIVNIIILAMLYLVGFYVGKKYDYGHSPYWMAYAFPSLVSGLVFCKRFSDKVWMKLHPHSIGRVNVSHHYYGDSYDPGAGVLGIILKYLFYMIVGFVIFPAYSLWAIVAVVWLTVSIYLNRDKLNGGSEDVNK